MPANDKWWDRQLLEGMKEASVLFDKFQNAFEPNVDDLDK